MKVVPHAFSKIPFHQKNCLICLDLIGIYKHFFKLKIELACFKKPKVQSNKDGGSFNIYNKKVLLRERKRHTTRRVVSTPSVVLTGYPPGRVPPCPDLAGGGSCWGGYPIPGYPHPNLARGVPYWGYPTWVPPHPDLTRGYPIWVPPQQGTPWQGTTPHPWQGTPHQGTPPAGYPPAGPGRVPPLRCLPHGIPGNVAKHYGIWVPLLWTDRQRRVKT